MSIVLRQLLVEYIETKALDEGHIFLSCKIRDVSPSEHLYCRMTHMIISCDGLGSEDFVPG